PDDIAKEHATITMLKMIQSGALNESWIGAKINPDYQIIYDINGEKLFYQFSVEKNGATIGIINAAASKVLGGSVISIGSIMPSISWGDLNDRSKKIVADNFSGYVQTSNKLVCVDYPAISQMITLNNVDTGDVKTLIIDSRDRSIKLFDSSNIAINSQNLSYYAQISLDEMTRGISIWNQGNATISSLKKRWTSVNPEILKNYSNM